ncbi:MAG TPA: hypothetical protein VGM54_01885 [Chthoniobacter sp.]|jgi:hypothetical protein
MLGNLVFLFGLETQETRGEKGGWRKITGWVIGVFISENTAKNEWSGTGIAV